MGDSRLHFHYDNIFLNGSSLRGTSNKCQKYVIVRTGDTDVLVLFLSNVYKSAYIEPITRFGLTLALEKTDDQCFAAGSKIGY